MSKVYFLHLSDLHLARDSNVIGLYDQLKVYNQLKKPYGIYTTYDKDKLVSLTDLLTNDLFYADFILMTGDISSSSSKEDILFSRSLIEDDMSKNSMQDTSLLKNNIIKNFISKTFNTATYNNLSPSNILHLYRLSLEAPVPMEKIRHPHIILLPGNHDKLRYSKHTPITLHFKKELNFNLSFSKFWDPIGNLKRLEFETLEVTNIRKKLLFIKIDCTLDDYYVYIKDIGKGNFFDKLSEELEEKLSKINLDKYHPFVMLHYLPVKINNEALLLENYKKLLKILNKFKISHVFCGHTHKDKYHKYRDKVNIYCSSSTLSTGKAEDSRINLFCFDTNTNKISVNKKFYWNGKDFIEAKNFKQYS